MNEEVLNMSVRKFLKTVGVTSQREIEKAVRQAEQSGRLPPDGALRATARVTIHVIDLDVTIDGDIHLR